MFNQQTFFERYYFLPHHLQVVGGLLFRMIDTKSPRDTWVSFPCTTYCSDWVWNPVLLVSRREKTTVRLYRRWKCLTLVLFFGFEKLYLGRGWLIKWSAYYFFSVSFFSSSKIDLCMSFVDIRLENSYLDVKISPFYVFGYSIILSGNNSTFWLCFFFNLVICWRLLAVRLVFLCWICFILRRYCCLCAWSNGLMAPRWIEMIPLLCPLLSCPYLLRLYPLSLTWPNDSLRRLVLGQRITERPRIIHVVDRRTILFA